MPDQPTYDVLIRDTETGEERRITMPHEWGEDGSEQAETSLFLWTDGNYGCDCNRAIFFLGESADVEHPCGDVRYQVTKAILPDGREVEIDGDV